MAEKFDQHSMEDMMKLAKSPAGQQLLTLLQQSAGQNMQQALRRAAAGDMAGAKELLSPALADPRIQALLNQMGGQ